MITHMNNHERDVGLPSEFLRTSRNAFFHIKFLKTFPHIFLFFFSITIYAHIYKGYINSSIANTSMYPIYGGFILTC